MISEKFEVLTPLSKIHRISRKMSVLGGLNVIPGQFVEITASGAVLASASSKVVELCISAAIDYTSTSATDGGKALAKYEANDTKLGRITTISEPGVRVMYTTMTGATAVGDAVKVTATGGVAVGATGVGKQIGIITGMSSEGIEVRLIEAV